MAILLAGHALSSDDSLLRRRGDARLSHRQSPLVKCLDRNFEAWPTDGTYGDYTPRAHMRGRRQPKTPASGIHQNSA